VGSDPETDSEKFLSLAPDWIQTAIEFMHDVTDEKIRSWMASSNDLVRGVPDELPTIRVMASALESTRLSDEDQDAFGALKALLPSVTSDPTLN
jgi:hypothetical protein